MRQALANIETNLPALLQANDKLPGILERCSFAWMKTHADRIGPYLPSPDDAGAERNVVSIIILAHNQLDHTRRCLESIERHTPEPHELILVDNGSPPEGAGMSVEPAALGGDVTRHTDG